MWIVYSCKELQFAITLSQTGKETNKDKLKVIPFQKYDHSLAI